MLQPGCTASLASNQAAYPSVLCSSCRYHTKPSVRGNSSRRDTLAAGLAVLPAIDNLWQPLPASAAVAAPPKPFCGVVDRVPSWAYNTPWQVRLQVKENQPTLLRSSHPGDLCVNAPQVSRLFLPVACMHISSIRADHTKPAFARVFGAGLIMQNQTCCHPNHPCRRTS